MPYVSHYRFQAGGGIFVTRSLLVHLLVLSAIWLNTVCMSNAQEAGGPTIVPLTLNKPVRAGVFLLPDPVPMFIIKSADAHMLSVACFVTCVSSLDEQGVALDRIYEQSTSSYIRTLRSDFRGNKGALGLFWRDRVT